MANAYDRLRAIARAEGGAYIIAPDSADPWPIEIWENVDLEMVAEDLSCLQAEIAEATPQELKEGTTSSGFYFTLEQRAFLRELGGATLDFPFASS